MKPRPQWEELFSLSEKEKTEIGKNRATALKDYSADPIAQSIVPPQLFAQWFLGLDENQVELLQEAREAEFAEEQRLEKQSEEE